MGRQRIYTDDERKMKKLERQRKYHERERKLYLTGTHNKTKQFDVKCPRCGKEHKYAYDVKRKYCDTCKDVVEGTFNTDLYALCM